VFRQALASTSDPDDSGRPDLGSALRDRAALVTLASETRTVGGGADQLAATLAEMHAARSHTSTQEQAWMLLAARALADQSRDSRLSVNGLAHHGAYQRTLAAAEIR